MTISATAIVMTYSLFTVDQKTKDPRLIWTIPLVMYGIFYYLYFTQIKKGGDAPDEALYKEKPILITVILFVIMIIIFRNIK